MDCMRPNISLSVYKLTLGCNTMGDIRELGEIIPLLDRPVIKYMSSSMGLYHTLGLTQKACFWALYRWIRCAIKIECAFRDVGSSQYLKRPTFFKSPIVSPFADVYTT